MIEKLDQLEQEAIRRGIPIIGPEKGYWLAEKVKQEQPHSILELGTANGYSGLILAGEGARLTTVDMSVPIAEEAKENFLNFGVNAAVVIGDVVDVVPQLVQDKERFDMIFIDCAKELYFSLLEDCIRLVRRGGLIIADNISFDGCADYKDAVLNHSQLETDIIDIKDGLSCSRKR